MDLAINAAVDRALKWHFVVPVLVFLSYAFGNPMDLRFTEFEVLAVAMTKGWGGEPGRLRRGILDVLVIGIAFTPFHPNTLIYKYLQGPFLGQVRSLSCRHPLVVLVQSSYLKSTL